MKRLAAAGLTIAAAVAASAPALAADLPQPAEPYTYNEPVPAERFDWSGFYFGGHLGWNWSDFQTNNAVTGRFNTRDNGVTGGVHAGYNYMLTPEFLLGAEADFSLTDIEKSRTVAGVNYKTSSDWNGTVRARAGWAFDRFLVFGTAGLAIADIEATANGSSQELHPYRLDGRRRSRGCRDAEHHGPCRIPVPELRQRQVRYRRPDLQDGSRQQPGPFRHELQVLTLTDRDVQGGSPATGSLLSFQGCEKRPRAPALPMPLPMPLPVLLPVPLPVSVPLL